MSSIPLILVGQSEEAGKAFSEAVQPDFEVIYFSTTPQSVLADLPQILKGEVPASAKPTTTTTAAADDGKDDAAPPRAAAIPRALVVGSPAYDDAWVESARREIASTAAAAAGGPGKRIPVLKPDWSIGAAAAAAAAGGKIGHGQGAAGVAVRGSGGGSGGIGVKAGVAVTVGSAEGARAAAERAVKVLRKLEEEGKLDGLDDGVYLY